MEIRPKIMYYSSSFSKLFADKKCVESIPSLENFSFFPLNKYDFIDI